MRQQVFGRQPKIKPRLQLSASSQLIESRHEDCPSQVPMILSGIKANPEFQDGSATKRWASGRGTRIALGLLILAIAFPTRAAWASEHRSVVRGRELYLRYCAPCHGVDADGRGPVAGDLKASPSDLRYLGERYGTPLPIATIARFIDGRQDVAAHGPRDMPVWGKRFYEAWTTHQAGEEDLQAQIREIVEYLNAIQQTPPPASPPSPISSR
jgi:mono/diheme cytochrome c family protein